RDHAGQLAVFLADMIPITRLQITLDRRFAHRFEQAAGSLFGKFVRDVLAGKTADESADARRIIRRCGSNVHRPLSFAENLGIKASVPSEVKRRAPRLASRRSC